MKLKFKNTPEQVELIKAMGSKRPETSREATEAFAAFIGPVIQQVLLQADTASAIYSNVEFDEDDNPSYPLDLFYEQRNADNYVTTWSQNMAGGLPSSQIAGAQELKIQTYRLDSAVSFLKKYARRGRLDVVSKAVERMAQEILVKQERNAWAVVLKALSEGTAATASTKGSHIVNQVGSTALFNLDILNAMITKAKRMNSSFASGSPAVPYSEGVTDLYVSPEVKQDVRAMSYSPIGNNADASLPEDIKSGAYKAAGIASIFGINIIDMLELGVGQKYNTLYDTFSDAAGIAGGTSAAGASVTTAFADGSSHEVCIGVDASRDALIRPVARNSESGSTFTALPDDQYSQRADKTGFYGSVEEGRVCIDARVLIGAHIKRT
ncbi:MAG: hypothetical protein CME35_01070 [Gramella sp.]|nr:hypothetical protein [Christiangramia sp.]|tara:strand:- start:2116 stop:3258 length:1143 start_codon:yes stop_codon:yes gene_type:complete